MDYSTAKGRYEIAKEQLYLNQETWDRDNEKSELDIMSKWQARCKHLEPDYDAVAKAGREMIPLTPESQMTLDPIRHVHPRGV